MVCGKVFSHLWLGHGKWRKGLHKKQLDDPSALKRPFKRFYCLSSVYALGLWPNACFPLWQLTRLASSTAMLFPLAGAWVGWQSNRLRLTGGRGQSHKRAALPVCALSCWAASTYPHLFSLVWVCICYNTRTHTCIHPYMPHTTDSIHIYTSC